MSEVALERVLAFNKELASLSAAGLQLDIGNRAEPINLVLDRANASLSLRTSLGQSVTDALAAGEKIGRYPIFSLNFAP